MKSFKEAILSNHSKHIFAWGTTSWAIMLQEWSLGYIAILGN